MATIPAVYENGVFRPTVPVDLAEGTAVRVEPADAQDIRAAVPAGMPDGLVRVYEVLARRYNSGHADTAERHNEHQP